MSGQAEVESVEKTDVADPLRRFETYRAIEDYRQRPLIVYATSTRQNVGAIMASDAVREFIDQLDALPQSDGVDILIHSTGGDGLTAWKLISTIRERLDNVSVLVPYMAFSAATLFCLGADEIVMHPNASLGPIDPQITLKVKDGKTKQFAYEDVGAFLRFLEQDAQLQDQEFVSRSVQQLFDDVDPISLGAAKRASELSSEIGGRLLSAHLEDEVEARAIATQLNKSFFAHGDAVSRTRAVELRLKIAERDLMLERLIWDAYLALEEHMLLREPFDGLALVLASPEGQAALLPPAPADVPPDTPPQIAQQIWQGVANQALSPTPGPIVPFEIVNAVVESPRHASEHRTQGVLSPTRSATGVAGVNVLNHSVKWQIVNNSPKS